MILDSGRTPAAGAQRRCRPRAFLTGRPRAKPAGHARATQAERRTRTREALLESAARGLSCYSYGNLVLEQLARDAARTRGAVSPVRRQGRPRARVRGLGRATWDREVGGAVEAEPDPAAALLALARRHAVFCRRKIARMAIPLQDTTAAIG
jgi:hypothetical protein